MQTDSEESMDGMDEFSIPSLPLPQTTEPIIVHQTGPVDNEYYPIFDPNRGHQSISNCNNNGYDEADKIDIDYINNDIDLLNDNDSDNDDEENKHCKNSINASNKSENAAITRWELTNTIKPYFMDNADGDDDENELWVKGATISSKEKANCTIIFNVENELQIGDHIEFKRKQNIPNHHHYYPHYYWPLRTMHPTPIQEGNGIIIRINNDGKRITISPLDTDDDLDDDIIISLSEYDVNRIKSRNETKLFKIVSTSELYLMSQFLRNILSDQPWRNVIEIASYLNHNYQRNVYFDCNKFEQMVQREYNKNNNGNNNGQKACSLCTMLNAMENTKCSICNNQFIEDNKHWLEKDECYESTIYELSNREHPTFPSDKERHEMYAKKPFLPIIPKKERVNLNTIQKRLKLVLKNDRNLYKYQLHTVLWCYIIERGILCKQRLCVGSNDLRFTNKENIKCAVYNIHNNKFIPSNISHIIPQRMMSYKGGIISDDVGLGKSLTLLSLIMAHPFNDNITSNSMSSITNKLEVGPNKKSIKCASTLIIAPSHLINQWKQEIIKHFKDNIVKILVITTSNEHNNITYDDILSSQIVLVSSQFIAGTHYQCLISQIGLRNPKKKHWESIDPSLPIKPSNIRHRIQTRSNKTKYRDLTQRTPFFELIYWRRIILDEAHDYLCNDKIRDAIFDIKSVFSWYVSATPFPNNQCIAHCADFLDIKFDQEINNNFYENVSWIDNLQQSLGHILHCILYYHLFSRHTKESILDDNYLPNIEEIVKYIDFHPVERLFYRMVESRRGTRMENKKLERRICSGVLNKFERNIFDGDLYHNDDNNNYLNDLLIINKRYYLSQIKKIPKELKYEQNHLKDLKKYDNELKEKKQEFEEKREEFTFRKAYKSEREREKHRNLRKKLKASKRRINEMELELIRYKKEYKMMENKQIIKDIEKYEKEFKNKMDGDILFKIVQKYGGKQAVLLEDIKKLHKNINNRIIIFSLFGATLNKIQRRLSQIGVHTVLCRGNVHLRKRAMAAFQTIDNDTNCNRNRIILLSLENAASGANLDKASHVILVDPVPGSSSESFAAEKQAIGRAVRQGMTQKNCTKVIRFVVTESIEQETYQRNMKIKEKGKEEKKEEEEIKYDLNKALKVKRRNSEIDFYLKIKDEQDEEEENDDDKSRKRKREKINDQQQQDVDDDIDDDIDEPVKKRRKLNDSLIV